WRSAVWCLYDVGRIGRAFGSTLWSGWNAAGLADFNRDGHPDYLLLNPSTGQTAIWYLNNNVRIGSAFGSTLWSGWNAAGLADFKHESAPGEHRIRPCRR